MTFRVLLSQLLVGGCVWFSSAQTNPCLVLLDSAQKAHERDALKAQFFLDSLMVQLDSGICKEEIGYAEAYHNAGLLYWNIQDGENALKYSRKSIEIKLQKVDSFSSVMLPFYDNLFEIHRDYGRYIEAGEYLDLAEKTFQGVDEENSDHLEHLLKSGIYFREIGNFEKSSKILRTALYILGKSETNTDSASGNFLIELGTLRASEGNYPEAEKNLERAISILRGNHPRLHLKAVDRMAKLKMESGDLTASENGLLSNISLKKSEFPDESLLLLESYNNLGILYFRLRDYESAQEYFQKMLNLGADLPLVRPFALNNLAVIALQNGELREAENLLLEAREFLRMNFGALHPEYANVLNNLASVYKEQRRLGESLDVYVKVLDLDKTVVGRDHPKYATSLGNMAQLYVQLGFLDRAREMHAKAIDIKIERLGRKHHDVATSYDNLGLVNLLLGDTVGALQNFDSALVININHIQKTFPVLTEAQRAQLFKNIRFNLQRYSATAFSENYFDTHWAERALDFFINTKSVLFYSFDKMRTRIQATKDQELSDAYTWWRKRNVDLANAYLMNEQERSVQGIDLSSLEQECQSLEKNLIRRVNATSSTDLEASSASWVGISHKLKPATAVFEMVQYKPYFLSVDSTGIHQKFEGISKYAGFVIKRDAELERVRWEQNLEFSEHFKRYSNSLKYGLTDKLSYTDLWKNVDQHLDGIDRLLYAPDGDWFEVNPSVFYDSENKEFVADKYEILNITSGKDLLTARRTGYFHTARVFGNPSFRDITDVELTPLPGAEGEARQLRKILEPENWIVDVFLGSKATEDAIKLSSHPGVLHIATHGYFNDKASDKSLLTSGLYLTPGYGQDGKLTAYEAMNLVLDETQLVVLSACETGLGRVHNGEGVFGLQRAFLVAGAEYLIISLTKINDVATSNFMNLFYNYFIATNNVESAFFSAQRDFRKVFPNPLLWGAFVLVTKH